MFGLNPWAILGFVVALALVGGAGYIKGGNDNEASHVALDLQNTKQVLSDFTDAAKGMNTVAGQFTAISQDLNSQIGDLSRKFRNGARQNPLPVDCRPDTFRMQSLSSAIGAANSAAGRIASPAVPTSK